MSKSINDVSLLSQIEDTIFYLDTTIDAMFTASSDLCAEEESHSPYKAVIHVIATEQNRHIKKLIKTLKKYQ